jgi:hypothetical protein
MSTSANKPIEDIEASLLAAPHEVGFGRVTITYGAGDMRGPAHVTADNGQQKSVRPGGDAGTSQLRVDSVEKVARDYRRIMIPFC